MTYQECLDKLKDYEHLWNKTVESDGVIYKIQHPLIVPIGKPEFASYIDSYLKQHKSAQVAITPFLNSDLQIVLKGNKISDGTIGLLEVSDIKLIP